MLAKKYRLQIQNWLKNKSKKIISRRSDFFIIRMSANDLFFSRFGVIISAKVSKLAVKRNKIKRIIYDFIRLNNLVGLEAEKLKRGIDVAITVLPTVAKLKKEEIEKELKNVITF